MLATIPLPAKVEGGAGLKAEFGDASLRALMSWQIDSDSVVMYNVLLEFEYYVILRRSDGEGGGYVSIGTFIFISRMCVWSLLLSMLFSLDSRKTQNHPPRCGGHTHQKLRSQALTSTRKLTQM